MKWGLDRDDLLIEKQKIKFPNKAILMENRFNNKPLGVGQNFRTTDEGIVCDISIPLELNTIAPGLKILKSRQVKKVKVIEKLELVELSFVPGHTDKSLENNFAKKYREQNKQ